MENEQDFIYMWAQLYDDTAVIFKIPKDSYINEQKYIRTGIQETDCILFDDVNNEFNTDAIYVYNKNTKEEYIRVIERDMIIRIKEMKRIK